MEALGDPREAVASPAVTEPNGDRNRTGPLPTWNAIEVANEVIEEVVGIQFFDDQLHERARPGDIRSARRERTHCTRTKLRPPPLGIELLFRPSGVFELTVDVDEDRTDLAHGCTSTNHGTSDARRLPTIAEGLGRPRGYGVWEKAPRGDVPTRRRTRVSGPWSGGDWRRGRE